MKKLLKKVLKRINQWNDYWKFIEEEKMKASRYTGSSGPLL